jgi:VanZ like family
MYRSCLKPSRSSCLEKVPSKRTGQAKRKMSVLIPLSYMGVIFILSSIPDTGRDGNFLALVDPRLQNLLHIPSYALLALLWILTLRTHGFSKYASLSVAFSVSSGYGALAELCQIWVPGRVPSVSDFLFDIAGAVLCIILYRKFNIEGRFQLHVSP